MNATTQELTSADPNGSPRRLRRGSVPRPVRRSGATCSSGPWLIGLVLFTAGPIIASLVMSLTNFDLVHADQTRFIGLDNYIRMTTDPLVATALVVDLQVRDDRHPRHDGGEPRVRAADEPPEACRGKGALRTLVYMPIMIPLVASTLVWIGFLNTETGWLNRLLELFGISGPDWFNSETWIYPALTLIGLWAIGNFMIINIAGLQSVPTELYEAARIDGAGSWSIFRQITIPLISPVLLYNLVIVLIAHVPVLHAGVHADQRPG